MLMALLLVFARLHTSHINRGYEVSRQIQRRHTIAGGISTLLVVVCFAVGYGLNRSLHMGTIVYVMEAVFAVSLMYFSISPIREMRRIVQKVENDTADDISTYQMYM